MRVQIRDYAMAAVLLGYGVRRAEAASKSKSMKVNPEIVVEESGAIDRRVDRCLHIPSRAEARLPHAVHLGRIALILHIYVGRFENDLSTAREIGAVFR